MQSPGSILIIDDDARNIFALAAVLRSRGYSPVSALSASQGIDVLLSNSSVKVVLLDMMMPDMDGYEALEKIRSTKGLEKIPVIAVTAQAMIGDREKIISAGADGYVSKPVDIDILIGILNQINEEYDR
jgi:two-component system, cell cycle response regulator DivK